jgi:type IV fimbrial biogenesis protein FimT
MRPPGQRGFTLVEIMISIAVLALLIMVGIPSFTIFIQNSRTRAAADATLNGLQTARNEAIRRNQCMQLKVVDQTGWEVATCGDAETAIMTRSAAEGTQKVVSTITPAGSDTVSFNGLGRVVNPNPSDNSAPFSQVVLDNSTLSATDNRQLVIVVPPGGGVRMCDPKVSSGDPRAC